MAKFAGLNSSTSANAKARKSMASFSSRALVAAAALLWAPRALADAFPETVEIDLLFPRNETYAPTTIFPFVFAIQNPSYFPLLGRDSTFQVRRRDKNDIIADPQMDLAYTNFTAASSPLYLYTVVTNMDNMTDASSIPYFFYWSFAGANCTGPQNGADGVGSTNYQNGIDFTIAEGGQAVDLVAATASGVCAQNSNNSETYNITGSTPVLEQDFDYVGTECALLSSTRPTPAANPCAAQIKSVEAASILAGATKLACEAATPVVSCPATATTTASSSATRRRAGAANRAAGYFAVFVSFVLSWEYGCF